MRHISIPCMVLISTFVAIEMNVCAVDAATAADQHCSGAVVVRARDKRLAGTFQRAGEWAGQPWYRKNDGVMTIYWTGSDAASGSWILGTTLGVRDLNSRIMAKRTGVILHSSKKFWKRNGQQSHDPTIAVYCDGDEQAADYGANGQNHHAASIAIFGQRLRTNVIMNGVYRISGQVANDHPVYQMNDLYLSANSANQWVITHADGIGSTNGMAYIRNEAQLAVGDISVGAEPDRPYWQLFAPDGKWTEDKGMRMARGMGGTVELQGRTGVNKIINGRYRTLERLCNNRFVYEKEGPHKNAFLFYNMDELRWMIGGEGDICTNRGWAFVNDGDIPTDDPDQSTDQWFVLSNDDGAFAADPAVSLARR
eukprot:m.149464 g.149464  ORF g.149464 m.149464 type:complete len:367 (-) comp17815_c0_seq1:224-1324(-)